MIANAISPSLLASSVLLAIYLSLMVQFLDNASSSCNGVPSDLCYMDPCFFLGKVPMSTLHNRVPMRDTSYIITYVIRLLKLDTASLFTKLFLNLLLSKYESGLKLIIWRHLLYRFLLRPRLLDMPYFIPLYTLYFE